MPIETSRKTSKRPGIDRLIAKKAYECYFPLHEVNQMSFNLFLYLFN